MAWSSSSSLRVAECTYSRAKMSQRASVVLKNAPESPRGIYASHVAFITPIRYAVRSLHVAIQLSSVSLCMCMYGQTLDEVLIHEPRDLFYDALMEGPHKLASPHPLEKYFLQQPTRIEEQLKLYLNAQAFVQVRRGELFSSSSRSPYPGPSTLAQRLRLLYAQTELCFVSRFFSRAASSCTFRVVSVLRASRDFFSLVFFTKPFYLSVCIYSMAVSRGSLRARRSILLVCACREKEVYTGKNRARFVSL